jgi:hypothetical protein
VEFLVLPVLIGWGVLWVWALIDIGNRPDAQWRAAGESKTMWFLLVFVLQFFGLLFYLFSVRPKLASVAR